MLPSSLLMAVQNLDFLPARWRAKAAERRASRQEAAYEEVPLVGRRRDEED